MPLNAKPTKRNGRSNFMYSFFTRNESPLMSKLPGTTQIIINKIHVETSTGEKGSKYKMK